MSTHLTALRFVTPMYVMGLWLSGCTTTKLEFDRMTGTSFPNSVTVSGDTVSLTSIYFTADLILSVDEDDTSIPALTGATDPSDPDQYDYITVAELGSLESSYRSSSVGPDTWSCYWGTCTQYHIYGIVVDHYYEKSSGSRSTTTLGVMYDTTTRGAFAMFYKNSIISSDNNMYLRSTAHEIGHAYNLHHADGDGSTTIMNQTGAVGSTYVYEFSACSLDHLKNHPKDPYVWPGLGAYGTVSSTYHTCH